MIVTLTLNPALDLTYSLTEAWVGEVDVHRAEAATIEASGKGVNVARALHANGVGTVAVLPLGGSTGRQLSELLTAEQVPHRIVAAQTPTRINTTMALWDGGTAKVNGPGGTLPSADLDALLHEVHHALHDCDEDDETWLAICGSLPPGVTPATIGDFVAVAHELGARCALDVSGDALIAGIAAGADLLAPNLLELTEVDPQIASAETVRRIAQVASGIARTTGAALLISLGEDGALYADGADVLHGRGSALVPVNTAGAGDALLSGWLAEAGAPADRMTRAIAWSRVACRAATTVAPAFAGTANTDIITITSL